MQGLNLRVYCDDYILPGDNFPYWLTFKGEGTSVKFIIPLINGAEHLKGMTICWVYVPSSDLHNNKTHESCMICLNIVNYTKTTTLLYSEDELKSLEEVEMNEIISNLDSNDQMEVKAVFEYGFSVKKTVVYLIYNDSCDEEMELSTSKAPTLSGTKHKREKEAAYQSIIQIKTKKR